MVKAKYEKQCNLIWNLGTKAGADNSLVTVLAIGQKHGFPYLQYLVDMYIRDKITFKVKHNKKLTVNDWAKANYYMQEVKNMDIQTNQKYYKMLSSAVSVFCHRVCPQIQLENIRVYCKDDIWKIADYIYAAARFASQSNPPNQMDFCIILKPTNDDVDEKKEQDDNSDDDSDDSAFDEEKIDQINFDDILRKIDKMKGNVSNIVDEDDWGEATVDRNVVRMFADLFRDFKNSQDLNSKERKMKAYPRNNRFCCVLDKRVKDKMYFCKPPSDCNEIYNDAVPELFFETSQKCLLPLYLTNKNKQITSKSANSQLMTFSFHIVAGNDIKCYLYYKGGMMRFFAEDIVDILPLFIIDDCQYYRDQDQEDKDLVISNIKLRLHDPNFKSFLKYGSRL